MKLRVKMWLVLGLVLLTVLALDLTTSWQKIHRDQRVEQEIDVQAMRALLMATRRVYHQQFIASELPVNEKTIGFLPAHSMARISQDYANWTNNGYRFNNVSDRPRNPANQADRGGGSGLDPPPRGGVATAPGSDGDHEGGHDLVECGQVGLGDHLGLDQHHERGVGRAGGDGVFPGQPRNA